MRVLSPKAQTMLADLAPFLANDAQVQGLINAEANEAQRIEDTATLMTATLFPTQADDIPLLGGKYLAPLLSMWEELLGLPVAPAGISVADRRSKVLAHIRTRNSGAGSDWVSILTTAVGSLTWSYSEGPGDYQLTINVPFSGDYSAHQVAVLAAAITPAHMQIVTGFQQGFIIGISLIGDHI